MILQSQKNRPKKFGLYGILFLGAMITVSDVFAHGISESDKQSMLDGGHLVFYAIEAIKGSPVSERMQEYAFRFGFAVLIGMMLFANLNDIFQLVM